VSLWLVPFTGQKETTAMENKVAGSRRVGKELRLLPEEAAFVGVDVHKRSYHVSVWTELREWVAQWTQPADPEALCRRLEAVRRQVAHVVYEAGPTGFALARLLRGHGFAADVVAPSKTPVASGRTNKSDRRDSGRLCFFDAKGMLSPIYVLTVQEEADRQVLRGREQRLGDVGRTQRRIKSLLLQYGLAEPAGLKNWSHAAVRELRELELVEELRFCLGQLLDELDHGRTQMAAAKERVRRLAASGRHAAAMALLCSVPGVGLITAMTFLTELPHPERFTRPEAIAAITGLAPQVRRSGETAKGGPILKAGNSHLRRVLVQAAWQWVRRDPAARGLFGHLVGETGCAQKAIVGVARHLAILLWHLVTTQSAYTPGRLESEPWGPADAPDPARGEVAP
jgi:transposase